MNAAFLLMTSALLVGQGGDKKTTPPAATPAVSSSCGQDPCGCDRFGHRLREKLRGLFSRDCNDSCATPKACCGTAHARTPLFRSRCHEACQPKIWNWQPPCRQPRCHQTCAPAACNDPCARGGFNLLERLRGAFRRGDSCCSGGCSSGAATTGEKVDPPKNMPKGGTKQPEEVRVVPQPAPFTPSVAPVAPNVPGLEIAPVPVPTPRIEGGRRDPF
ncbi:MAG: hypothetical protein HYX68_09090 [Planctomycetes bacterium]|nr:hypothetical protein [Planctomycetota bacterium]